MFRKIFAWIHLFGLAFGPACALDASPSSSPWEFSAEYIYFRPTLDNTYYVLDAPNFSIQPIGKRRNHNIDYQSGFRVGAYYDLTEEDRQLKASYTRLDISDKKRVEGNFLSGTRDDAEFVGSEIQNYDGIADSCPDLLYQRGDILYTQNVYRNRCLKIDIEAGVEIVSIRYTQRNLFLSDFDRGFIRDISKTDGAGPELGMTMSYQLASGICSFPGSFSIIAHASGSLLAVNSRSKNFNGINDDENRSSFNEFLNISHKRNCRIIPAFHSRLGLGYERQICCLCTHFEIGYEISSYIKALTGALYPADGAPTLALSQYNSFGLEGLYVSATVRF